MHNGNSDVELGKVVKYILNLKFLCLFYKKQYETFSPKIKPSVCPSTNKLTLPYTCGKGTGRGKYFYIQSGKFYITEWNIIKIKQQEQQKNYSYIAFRKV